VVVTTKPEPIKLKDLQGLATKVILDPIEGINLSRWWNLGLNHIASKTGDGRYEVLVTSSDCYGSQEGVQQLAAALRQYDLSMVGPDWHGRLDPGTVEPYTPESVRTAWQRVPGACFMLAGEEQLRADEEFRWWYCDDHLEMTARHAGGAALVGRVDLHHHGDHMLSAEQADWATEDRAKYVAAWGREPW
jgi:hypothetical protein